jgi:hypothetical protein
MGTATEGNATNINSTIGLPFATPTYNYLTKV